MKRIQTINSWPLNYKKKKKKLRMKRSVKVRSYSVQNTYNKAAKILELRRWGQGLQFKLFRNLDFECEYY